MTELIVFDDAEALTIQHLLTVVSDAHISSDAPAPLPARLVTIQRVGGTKQNLVTDGPLLIIQTWSKDKGDAYDLCKLVRAHIDAMPGNSVAGTWVYKVTEVGGVAYFPDPDSRDYARYQFTVQLRLRGSSI